MLRVQNIFKLNKYERFKINNRIFCLENLDIKKKIKSASRKLWNYLTYAIFLK